LNFQYKDKKLTREDLTAGKKKVLTSGHADRQASIRFNLVITHVSPNWAHFGSKSSQDDQFEFSSINWKSSYYVWFARPLCRAFLARSCIENFSSILRHLVTSLHNFRVLLLTTLHLPPPIYYMTTGQPCAEGIKVPRTAINFSVFAALCT
jgi:hypothetical protein